MTNGIYVAMKKKVKLIISFAFLIILNACSANRDICKLSSDFSEDDLHGTWVASRHVYPKIRDTLIIRNDGLYKQTIEMESPPTHYESEWLPWRIEYSGNDLTYLHMQGMRLCAYISDIFDCSVVGGGDFYWYDSCTGETTQMPVGEGVLIIIDIRSNLTKSDQDIVLDLLSAHPEDSSWRYKYESP